MKIKYNLCQPIPRELRVRGADSHMYSIGLSLFKPQTNTKRHILYHPFIVFIVILLTTIKQLIYVYLASNNITVPLIWHLYFDNYEHYLPGSNVANILASLLNIFCIYLQIINYINYRNGIKPTDLRVFRVLAGYITPKRIGITDKRLVYKLIKTSKLALKISLLINKLTPFMLFLIISLIFIKVPTNDFIFIAVCNNYL